ncbi:MAG: T9SS type A sorting domain-containing protein [Flavobacteriales bacterium]
MKKNILLLSAAFTLVSGALSAQYSNASWSGPWIGESSVLNDYNIFDGNGNITEAGIVGSTGGQGTYTILSNGAVSGSIKLGSGTPAPFAGNFINDSTASVTVSGILPASFYKVKDVAVMAGTYSGTVTQNVGGSATRNISFDVDNNGHIVSSTDLTGIISGHLYFCRGKVYGMIKCGEAAPFTEISFYSTNYDGSALSGTSAFTVYNSTGTFSLSKSSGVGVSSISSSKVSAYPNPTQDQFTVEGANGSVFMVYDILGNQVLKTALTSSKVLLSTKSLGINSGVYFYSIQGNGVSTQGKFVVE